MSHHPAPQPECLEHKGSIRLLIRPKERDLGEFSVRRVLPAVQQRHVGPFVFFDHMGPAEFPPGLGIQVRPHPHIGLATVTYLFEGQIMHRDSLGYVQPIRPGAVNLMTAGKGIVHSERAGDDLDQVSKLHGIQSWMALPVEHEETDPAFVHHPETTLPKFEQDGVTGRVIIGDAHGQSSPVETFSPMIYVEYKLAKGQSIVLPDHYQELGFYVVTGSVSVGDQSCDAGVMAIPESPKGVRLDASDDAHVMLVGGDSLGPRFMYWNFVSSSQERIEQAKKDWRDMRFQLVPGDDEFIPLPD